jgi:hypothetical protein
MLNGKIEPAKDPKSSDKSRPSPIKSKTDLKAHFSEPPAPPPSAPLPEKPDVARALADPIIQPLLRRNDTFRPPSEATSPTRPDHSSDILRLCEELKSAKGEITNQSERMKLLESGLAQERSARGAAEERVQRLEERRDSPRDSFNDDLGSSASTEYPKDGPPDLQVQLDRLRLSMDEMKQQMESYRRRAETAESERDEVRQSLAELVEQKRRENSERTGVRASGTTSPRTSGKQPIPATLSRSISSDPSKADPSLPNGHAIPPTPLSPTSYVLLERAGVEEGRPITPEQAKLLTQFLTQEVLRGVDPDKGLLVGERRYHGREIVSAVAVVMVGVCMMGWMNGWVKVDR